MEAGVISYLSRKLPASDTWRFFWKDVIRLKLAHSCLQQFFHVMFLESNRVIKWCETPSGLKWIKSVDNSKLFNTLFLTHNTCKHIMWHPALRGENTCFPNQECKLCDVVLRILLSSPTLCKVGWKNYLNDSPVFSLSWYILDSLFPPIPHTLFLWKIWKQMPEVNTASWPLIWWVSMYLFVFILTGIGTSQPRKC